MAQPADPSPPLPPSHEIELAPGVRARSDALRLQYARSSGPGGQNVNKLNTRAELWLRLDGLVGLSTSALNRLRRLAGKRFTRDGCIHLVAQDERSQNRNREALFERLGAMIAEARIEPKPRKPTRPGRAAKRRRLDSKRRRSDIKSGRSSRGESWD